jgi:aldehyde dehydrogenase (NAD+)
MDFSEIVKRQNDYFNSNQTKEIAFRIDQLKKLKSLIRDRESVLYKAIYDDYKKSTFEAYATELSFVYHELNEAIKKLPLWSKRKKVTTNIVNFPGRSFIIPEPLGVCLVIGAWNYPYQLSLVPLVNAMAAGNTVVLKPSEIPAATSAAMASLINENFPSEYLFVVEGGVEVSTSLLQQKFDKIFFTGSTAVGKIVYEAAAKHLTPVTLELGGKSPAIITRNSNLKDAAKRLVWAKYLNSGQTCITPDYLLVDESIKDELLGLMKEYIIQNEYSFENDNYVQIINERNFNRIFSLMDGMKVYHGGNADAEKRYIAPTILTDVTFEDSIMDEEIFGPVLPVVSYSNLDDAVREIKKKPKPLACYIFSNDKVLQEKLLNEISFGGGAVNDTLMHISNSHLPFGGVGSSGTGTYHGKAGFASFSHFKGIIDKPFWFEPNLKYPPYTKKKLWWLKRLLE